MRHLMIVAIVMIVSFFTSLPVEAQSVRQHSRAQVPVSLIGMKGEPVQARMDITYDRNAALAEPIIDWNATFVYSVRAFADGAKIPRGARLKRDGLYGQLFTRAFEHAKRLRDRGLPDGRFGITFEFIEQLEVKDPQDSETVIALAFLGLHDGRGFADGLILGGLDSEGRLKPVTDLNQRLTVMLKRGVRKVIIPSGQIKEISDLPQQAIDTGKLDVTEAATLKDVYDLATYPGRIRHPGDPP
jgi:hypothetical protein